MTRYAGLNNAANDELERIDSLDERERIARAVLDSGIAGPARIYFIKALRHALGHKAKRGDTIVPIPTPPGNLRPGELAIIDQRVEDARQALILAGTPADPAHRPPPIPPERIEPAQRDRGRSWGEA